MNKYERSHFMMDIYLKFRDSDVIDFSSREHWRFVSKSGIVEYQGSHRRTRVA